MGPMTDVAYQEGTKTEPYEGTRAYYTVGIGVDVGQKTDPSAIAVAEMRWKPGKAGKEGMFYVRHMETLPLATSFKDVAVRVARVCDGVTDLLYGDWQAEDWRRQAKSMQISDGSWVRPPRPRIFLRVDSTGLGLPVVEMIEDELTGRTKRITKVQACWFTPGDRITREKGSYRVGKAHLVSRLKAVQQSGLLKIAPSIVAAEDVIQEFLDYEIKVSEDANDKYGAFKVGTHDDLVTALGLAVLKTPSTRQKLVSPVGFS